MLTILDEGIRLCDGLSRREWLRVGGIGGLSLAALAEWRRAGAQAGSPDRAFGKARACIIFGLVGGPPQHETFDPKPEAPPEIRGPFAPIETSLAGLRVCELMPRVAQEAHRLCVLRAASTGDNAHSTSGYYMLTGHPHQPMNRESVGPGAPNDHPSLGALVRAVRPAGGLPAAVTLPEHIWNDGNIPWPGQDAGRLGRALDPWLIHCDPSAENFEVPAFSLPGEVPALRFDRRRTLLAQVDQHLSRLDRMAGIGQFDAWSRQAIDLLRSPHARQAFELGREPAAVRDRYGRSRFAQSVLLARRLVEAGVCLVQVNWTRIKDQPNQGGWDTHEKNAASLKDLLMPIMDQAFSALLEDLAARGLLDETLVVWMGEFGRTPRHNARAGRDHWGSVFSMALAGAGVRAGHVHGASDKIGALPTDGVVRPEDLSATIFHCLGLPSSTVVRDTLGRPHALSTGKVLSQLLA